MPQPMFVRVTARSSAAWELAGQLALRGDPTDSSAIAKLQHVSGGSRKELLRAAALACQAGHIEEDRFTRVVNDVLLAAAGEQVSVITPDEEQWFSTIGSFRELSTEAAFDVLCQSVPELRSTLGAMISGAREYRHRGLTVDEETVLDIDKRLPLLVGPRSRARSRLVRSHAALETAETKFMEALGVLEEQ